VIPGMNMGGAGDTLTLSADERSSVREQGGSLVIGS
jgi:hypothetical protein